MSDYHLYETPGDQQVSLKTSHATAVENAMKFAPVVWLFKGEIDKKTVTESYLPYKIADYIGAVELEYYDKDNPAVTAVAAGSVTPAILASQVELPSGGGKPGGPGAVKGQPNGYTESWKLKIPEAKVTSITPGVPVDQINSVPFYVHAFKAENGDIDIAYWFFYAYNGSTSHDADVPLGNALDIDGHQSDLEHIVVRVDSGLSEVKCVYCAQHSGGTWYSPPAVTLVPEDSDPTGPATRPVIYSAHNSHASYPDPGNTTYGSWPLTATVERRNKGVEWNPDTVVVLDSNPWNATDDHAWIRYLGDWGGTTKDITGSEANLLGLALRPSWNQTPGPAPSDDWTLMSKVTVSSGSTDNKEPNSPFIEGWNPYGSSQLKWEVQNPEGYSGPTPQFVCKHQKWETPLKKIKKSKSKWWSDIKDGTVVPLLPKGDVGAESIYLYCTAEPSATAVDFEVSVYISKLPATPPS